MMSLQELRGCLLLVVDLNYLSIKSFKVGDLEAALFA